jgi:hypothetical protein
MLQYKATKKFNRFVQVIMLTSFIIKWGYLQLFSTNRVEGLGSFYIYYTGIDDSSFEEHPLMTYKQVTDRNVCVTVQALLHGFQHFIIG